MYFKNCKSIVTRKYSSQENTNIVIKLQITILIKVTSNRLIKEFSKNKMSLKAIMIYNKLALKMIKGSQIFKIYLVNKNKTST